MSIWVEYAYIYKKKTYMRISREMWLYVNFVEFSFFFRIYNPKKVKYLIITRKGEVWNLFAYFFLCYFRTPHTHTHIYTHTIICIVITKIQCMCGAFFYSICTTINYYVGSTWITNEARNKKKWIFFLTGEFWGGLMVIICGYI